jgi:hypothetical protein
MTEPAPKDVVEVRQPAKLLRLALSVRNTLNEVRAVELDETALGRLHEIHERTVRSVKELLSSDLRTEFESDVEVLVGDGRSQAELRVAQARLMGWLEGLFQGIQATAFDERLSRELRDAVRGAGDEHEADRDERGGGYI